MRILYGASNRVGASFQLEGFLSHSAHTVRVAAWLNGSQSIQTVDWTLDALKSKQALNLFKEDVRQYRPDLVISDDEPYTAKLAHKLRIPLWYCSPIHLLDGVKWKFRTLSGYASPILDIRNTINGLPYAEKKLIYSPFGDLADPPTIRDDFEWVTPYHEKVANKNYNQTIAFIAGDRSLSDILKCYGDTLIFKSFSDDYYGALSESRRYFTTGSTNSLADAIYNNKQICISPNLNDYEEVLNAIGCSAFGVGSDIGQVEYMERFALEYVEKAFEKSKAYSVSIKNKKLHEKV